MKPLNLVARIVLICFFASLTSALAQNTMFTYQGQLLDGGRPANGLYDLQFSLWRTNTTGTVLAGPVTNSATSVSNGLFTVALDFGNMFDGTARWLEISVRTNGSPDTFTTLTGRQAITPAPSALFANTASNVSGTVSASQVNGTIPLIQLPAVLLTNNQAGVLLNGTFSGTYTGNGSGLTSVPAGSLTGTIGNPSLSAGVALTTGGSDSLPFVSGAIAGTGIGPDSVTTADVNGDGKMDLITANFTDNFLTVLTNNGSGGFSLLQNVTTAYNARFVVAADVNGDGKPDLITAISSSTSSSSTIIVLLNNGTGQFAASQTVNIGSHPYCIAVADVNADGKPDLITANSSDNTLSVLLNNGSGQFSVIQTVTVGSTPRWVTAADVNGDGKVDLITANNNSTLTVLTNNGSGQFTVTQTLGGSSSPPCVVAADYNNDGKADLACIAANNKLAIFFNNGSGQFNLAQTVDVGGGQFAQPYALVTLDLNGDGRPDLACVNGGNNFGATYSSVSVLTNVNATSLGGSRMTFDVNGVVLSTNVNMAGHPIFMKSEGDANHGLGYVASVTNFNGLGAPDGPVLWGYDGGALGSMNTGIKLALVWTKSGIGIGTTNILAGHSIDTASGAYLTSAGVWTSVSDRNVKEDFTDIEPQAVLAKVAAMPITQWKYKQEADGIKHIGPVAQDFYGAFGLGDSERAIGSIDEDGVALAAIQGLNQKLQQKDVEIQKLADQLKELQAAVKALQATHTHP